MFAMGRPTNLLFNKTSINNLRLGNTQQTKLPDDKISIIVNTFVNTANQNTDLNVYNYNNVFGADDKENRCISNNVNDDDDDDDD